MYAAVYRIRELCNVSVPPLRSSSDLGRVRVPDPPTHLGSELVQLDSSHTIVDASNDLLGDLDGVYVISVEAPAELLDPVGQPAA